MEWNVVLARIGSISAPKTPRMMELVGNELQGRRDCGGIDHRELTCCGITLRQWCGWAGGAEHSACDWFHLSPETSLQVHETFRSETAPAIQRYSLEPNDPQFKASTYIDKLFYATITPGLETCIQKKVKSLCKHKYMRVLGFNIQNFCIHLSVCKFFSPSLCSMYHMCSNWSCIERQTI